MLRKLFQEDGGQGLVEYALILGFIAVAVMGILFGIGEHIRDGFQFISDHMKEML